MSRKLAVKGCLSLALLSSIATGVQGKEDYDRTHCPKENEWASTIDPENRPFFLEFSKTAIWAHGPDVTSNEGVGEIDRLFSFLTHAYHDIPEYRNEISSLFELMSKEPGPRERFGETALLEIAQCMGGGLQVDCAQMAIEKGYVKPLEDLINEPSFNETLQFLKEACRENKDEIR
ncbi:hypothetical protein IWQ51_006739 [Labrenzia sp. EL_142]|nr:hypothetical protein [Labrenzia sp. EL_142]